MSVAGRTLSILVMMLGIALPAVIIVRDRAQAAKCLNDAKGIALACKLYALDHQGDYPPNLEQLVPKYLPDAKIFECPLRKNQPPVGYNYFGGKDSDPPTKVLLSSKATTRNHKRIIITADAAGVLQRED